MKKPTQFLNKKSPQPKFQSEYQNFQHKKQYNNNYPIYPKYLNNNKVPLIYNDQSQQLKKKLNENPSKITQSKVTTESSQNCVITNLRSQLSTLKQEVQKLISNDDVDNTIHKDKNIEIVLNETQNKFFVDSSRRLEKKKFENLCNQEQILNLKHQVSRLKKECIKNIDIINDLKQKNENLEKVSKNTENEYNIYKEKMQMEIKLNTNQTDIQNVSLKKEIKKLLDRQKSIIEQKNEIITINDKKIKMIIQQKQNLLNQSQSQIKLLIDQYENEKLNVQKNYNYTIQILKREKAQLQRKSINLQKKYDELESLKKQSQNNFNQIISRKQKQILILKQQIIVLEKITANKDNINSQKQKLEQIIKQQGSEIETLKTSLNHSIQNQQLWSQIKQSNHKTIIELQQQIQNLKTQNILLFQQINTLKQREYNIKCQLELRIQQNKKTEASLYQIIKENQSQIQNLKNNIIANQQLITQSNNLLQSRDEEFEKYKKMQMQTHQNQKFMLQNQINQLIQNKKLSQQYLINNCHKYENFSNELQKQIAKKSDIINNLYMNLKNLQMEVVKSHNICRYLVSTQILLKQANEDLIRMSLKSLDKQLFQKYQEFQ